MTKLKVTSIRYFNTRRGLGYQCKTNVKGIEIWNDGNGGGTFIERTKADAPKHYSLEYTEVELEMLIDKHEGVTR
tara:strand:+ start:1323 stop:1547 length:225 start_codon:yes stop_codon:yes gene_type:complete